jgi:sugar lactone lactonase YvrE
MLVSRRRLLVSALAPVALAALPAPVAAFPGPPPGVMALPNAFQPEGVAIGAGGIFYVGSIPTGAIYRGDVRTGAGAILVPPTAGRNAIGMKVDSRKRLFVAGGPSGQGYVYDATTGATLRLFRFADPAAGGTFVNDVVVTRDAAWFTDSLRPVLYRVPIASNGTIGQPADVEVVPLTGDIVYTTGFNVNGIAATADGKRLVIVQTNTGRLFSVDPATGVASGIDLGGATVPFGDGILLAGQTLYVVQNRLNQVAVIEVARDLSAGEVLGTLTDPALDVPTTISLYGYALYAVNARFGVAVTPETTYSIVRLRPRPVS